MNVHSNDSSEAILYFVVNNKVLIQAEIVA